MAEQLNVYGWAVHVHNGRRLHRALDGIRTLCGQQWVAAIVGPPADQMPECRRCKREQGRG